MKDIFYTLGSIILFGFLVLCILIRTSDNPKVSKDQLTKGIVVDKDRSVVLGKTIVILDSNNEFKINFVYDIVFNNVNVGDTIK